MSVLSRPQGMPERVWSLISGLSAIGGEVARDEFISLVNPGYDRGGVDVKASPVLAAEATGVATALGLVERHGAVVRLSVESRPGNYAAFADTVHDILRNTGDDDLNRVIFEAYAWLVAESHRKQDLGWIFEVGNDAFADMIDAGLVGEDEDGRLMNPTKATAWRRWLRFLGLGVALPDDTNDYPTPARRMAIEIRRAGLTPGSSMHAEEFVRVLGERCPYLDRGRLFVQACERIGHNLLDRQLSAVTSAGLRDLESDGLLALNLSGDASDALALTADRSFRRNTFNSVVVQAEVV